MFLRHLQHSLKHLNKIHPIKRQCSSSKYNNLKLRLINTYLGWTICSGVGGSCYGVKFWYDTCIGTNDSIITQSLLFPVIICTGTIAGLLYGISTPIIILTYSMNLIKKRINKE